jgi:Flp pilus assembly protein TadD
MLEAYALPGIRRPFCLRRHFHTLLNVSAIALLCALVYSNTLDVPFVFDDPRSITENRHIRISSLDPRTLFAAAFDSPLHRPVASLSFALTYYFWEYDVTAYHAVNTLIHALNGVLVYWLALIVFARSSGNKRESPPDARLRGLALFSACLFVAHPLQIQSVTYVVQRMNSLSTMFYLLALLLYLVGRSAKLHGRRRALWLGSLVSWVLAMGSKEIAATLPVIILLYELLLTRDLRLGSIKNALWKAAAAGLLILPVIIVYWPRFVGFAARDFNMWERLLTQCRVVVLYGSLVLYPHPGRLNLLHEISTSRSLVDPVSTLASLVLILVVLALAFWFARRRPLVSFCILWIAANLIIESSAVHLDMIFEHRTYLPMVGVALLAGYGVGRVPERMWKSTGALGVAVLLLLGTAAHVRNRTWGDEVTLWSDVASKSKGDVRIFTNLGNALQRVGRLEEAIRYQRRASEIEPDSATPHNNLGSAMMLNGQIEQALAHFTESIRLSPYLGSAHANMGLALQKLGREDEAIEAFVKAVRFNPRLAGAHHRLAIVLSQQGRLDEAANAFSAALRINPRSAEAHDGLGVTLVRAGKPIEARNHFLEALRIDPNHASARANLNRINAD